MTQALLDFFVTKVQIKYRYKYKYILHVCQLYTNDSSIINTVGALSIAPRGDFLPTQSHPTHPTYSTTVQNPSQTALLKKKNYTNICYTFTFLFIYSVLIPHLIWSCYYLQLCKYFVLICKCDDEESMCGVICY